MNDLKNKDNIENKEENLEKIIENPQIVNKGKKNNSRSIFLKFKEWGLNCHKIRELYEI